jgi:hypothetical protein
LAQTDFLGDRESVDVEVGKRGVGRKVTAQDDGTLRKPPRKSAHIPKGFRKGRVSTNVS